MQLWVMRARPSFPVEEAIAGSSPPEAYDEPQCPDHSNRDAGHQGEVRDEIRKGHEHDACHHVRKAALLSSVDEHRKTDETDHE
jgi:hypothetical protein